MRAPANDRLPSRPKSCHASPVAGSSARNASNRSSTVSASSPGASSSGDTGTIPCVDQRPWLTISPTVPVKLAGMRTEPVVSDPIASSAEPSSRLTPAPELEPPLIRCSRASHGLYGDP